VPVETLDKRLRQLRGASARLARAERPRPEGPDTPPTAEPASAPIRPADLDPTDRELVEIVLNEPRVVGPLISRVPAVSIRDAPLRTILQACYDLYGEGQEPTFERVALRLEDAGVRALVAGLLLPIDPQPVSEGVRPAPLDERLRGVLAKIAERDWRERLRDVQDALKETDATANPDEYRALQRELYRLYSKRPDTKTKNAS
jgi:DNA primase